MRSEEKRVLAYSLLLIGITQWIAAAEPPGGPEKWESQIAEFEKADEKTPPQPGGIVAVGSSSIRLWDFEKSFPDLSIINRGFGGSHLADSVHFASRIVLPYKPRTVVLYAGDNDLAAGKSPEQVFADFQEFVQRLRTELPEVRIIFIAVKPSIQRIKLIGKVRQTNRLIQDFCKSQSGLVYLDIFTPMLDEEGQPRKELFVKDGLHLNEKGYELWTSLLKPHLESE